MSATLPGAELLQPQQSLLYRIADAVVYPKRFGLRPDDCPTTAQIDDSEIQERLADGYFPYQPTLFDPDPKTPPKVVWLLFTGNHVESGPLVAYLALPGGRLPDRRVNWLGIELLLADGDTGPDGEEGDGSSRLRSLPASSAKPCAQSAAMIEITSSQLERARPIARVFSPARLTLARHIAGKSKRQVADAMARQPLRLRSSS